MNVTSTPASKTRTTTLAILLTIGGSLLGADQPQAVPAALTRTPNLAPALFSDEVTRGFAPWVESVKKMSPQWTPETSAEFEGARKALSPRLPKVTQITLYSLFPVDRSHFRKSLTGKADPLEQLPDFHGYPVFGAVRLDGEEANRWTDFLRDQIVPGESTTGEFMPRHAIRLTTEVSFTDILVCFQCGKLVVVGVDKPDSKYNPVFSPAVEAVLRILFDKNKIEHVGVKPKPKDEAR